MRRYLKIFVFDIFAFLGRLYVKKHKPVIIGITGSVGKTSCRTIIYQILKQFLPEKIVYTSPKNYNSELGLVFSIFEFEKFNDNLSSLFGIYFVFLKELIFGKKKYDILLLEYGVDHPGDMDFLLKIAKPDFSIFTKLDLIHLENFSKKEDILNEKMKLILNTKNKAHLNYEDFYQKEISTALKIPFEFYNKKRLLTSYDSVLNQVQDDGSKGRGILDFKYIGENNKIFSLLKIENKLVKTNILGVDNFAYLELGLEILKNFSIDFPQTNIYIPLQIQAGRFALFNGINNSVLIDSTYNAGPESMLKMIQNTIYLRDSLFKNYKILFVIGDMRELGIKSNQEHKRLYYYLRNFGEIISIGTKTKENFGSHLSNFKYSKNAGKFLYNFLNNSKEKYIILFKGSQNTIFVEEALKEVLVSKNNFQKLVRQSEFWLKKKESY